MARKSTRYPNVYQRGRKFYYRFKNESGKWQERAYGTDLKAAVQAQIQSQNDANAIRHGITTRERLNTRDAASTSYDGWLKKYKAHFDASGNTTAHVKACIQRCRAAEADMNLRTLADITRGKVEDWLNTISNAGAAARTRNDYLVKLSAFLNWLCGRGALPSNPIAFIKLHSTAADPIRPARALTPEEFSRLLDATPKPRRRLAYWLAGSLGLRWSEIRKLKWTSINLHTGEVTLPASISKNRKEACLPIPSSLLAVLREQKNKRGRVCPRPPIRRTWNEDLERAGIKHKTDAGQADRRCLRKTYVTHLALAGVDLRTAQRLARHSKPELTANIYTDHRLLDMKDAAAKLAAMHPPAKNAG